MSNLDEFLEAVVVEMIADVLPNSLGKKKTKKLLESYAINGGKTSERLADEDENFDNWLSLSIGNFRTLALDSQQARKVIQTSRTFWESSEVYKNALRHRRNFILGSYISFDLMPVGYRTVGVAEVIKKMGSDARLKKFANSWRDFWRRNNMWKRINSWATKRDRDGNVILRLFGEGRDTEVRFVDPMQILDSGGLTNNIPEFGIAPKNIGVIVDSDDIESILGMAIRTVNADDGGEGEAEYVPIDELIFDKVSEDFDSVLGVPIGYACFTNIRRAEKLLLNASTLTQIQTAIALIRKHTQGMNGGSISGFANRNATGTRKDKETNRDIRTKRITAGTILDAKAGTEYDFPGHNVRAEGWIDMMHEELARISLCFDVPVDWLLAKEVENPLNPGSPFLRSFLQSRQDFFSVLEELYWKVQSRVHGESKVKALQDEYELVITAPVIPTAKLLDQARVDDIYLKHSVKSPQQIAREQGTRYELMRSEVIENRKTKQPGEQFPSDAGNTQVNNNQNTDGMTNTDGTVRSADGSGGNNQ